MNEETVSNKLRELFPEAGKPLFRYALKHRNKIIRVYNGFCDPCRSLCFADSTRPFEDYCKKCQEMARKILE